ncbi:MAG: 4Fe-4S binding protein [Candidatus Edwardsbacteria bacterium]|nr:4Fe-4S binding protein [Candidatus Edwardsbacteria bacterium]MBU1576296.1 4Fe-4S binding protein [Candidatus Edwardsbacteria bacterium]
MSTKFTDSFLKLLPGLDCGLCRLEDGCLGYAQRLAQGEPDISRCLPGGENLKAKLAEMQAETVMPRSSVASFVDCQGSTENARNRFNYFGVDSCRGAMLLYGGNRECLYGCLRLGDCITACPYGAIGLTPQGLPKIDYSKCTGCGRCTNACPKGILKLAPKTQQIYLACICQAKSEGLPGQCRQGCSTCGSCLKECPYGAIIWDGSLPKIDYEKCRSCSICVYKCPQKSYLDRIPNRPTAFIGLQCNGCQQCKSVCPTDCIIGKKGEHHKVMRGQCIGCGLCFEVCPIKAVTMLGALGHVDLSGF